MTSYSKALLFYGQQDKNEDTKLQICLVSTQGEYETERRLARKLKQLIGKQCYVIEN